VINLLIVEESLIVILFISSLFIFAYAIRSLIFLVIITIPIVVSSTTITNISFFFKKIHVSFPATKTVFDNNHMYVYIKGLFLKYLSIKDIRDNSISINSKNKNKNSKSISTIRIKNQFLCNDKKTNNFNHLFPFISILIASYNENIVIERLLSSLYGLSYNFNRLEIIIIDDSNDGTFNILKKWQKELPNLKIIHRQSRKGWKGGALNLGIDNLNKNSDIILVVDADNILEEYTLEKIAIYSREIQEKEFSVLIIQGYPRSIIFPENKNSSMIIKPNNNIKIFHEYINCKNNNWISQGISFRLYQRNLIEFMAKEKINLPLQITGSLFAIKTSLLKSIRFSHDICEDWDLTLDIYLCEASNNIQSFLRNNIDDHTKVNLINNAYNSGNNGSNKKNKKIKKIIAFEQSLVSYTEITQSIQTYFRQRMRVSEGHTRGFRKRLIKIIKSDRIPLLYKLELLFLGLRYAKYIFIMLLIIIDLFMLLYIGIDVVLIHNFTKLSIGLQVLSLIIYIIFNLLSLGINHKLGIEGFTIKHIIYLLAVHICTIPAFTIGSLLGFVMSKGNFYRTKRKK
jgi:glycosyltransferase involved in cell wall biosynthesis